MAKQKRSLGQEITKGIIRENPLLRLLLGTCPALAVTTTVINGIGMGLAATFVLILSNVVIALIRKVIPDRVRIPVYITVIASFVTILQFLLQAYLPELDKSLGIFIPLITVNCIILGRAEAFAGKNSALVSALDGLGMGIGFTAALFLMGGIRELLGNGSLFDIALPFVGEGHMLKPILIMILPPGGFFVFGILIALSEKLSGRLYRLLPEKALDRAACPGSVSERTDSAMYGEAGKSDLRHTFPDRAIASAPEPIDATRAETDERKE